jgi:transcriptional regulator with XRE-family HTH domain
MRTYASFRWRIHNRSVTTANPSRSAASFTVNIIKISTLRVVFDVMHRLLILYNKLSTKASTLVVFLVIPSVSSLSNALEALVTKVERQGSGRFAEMFNKAMRDKGITLKELAAKSEYQYESFRKLARGMTNPSREMVRFLHEQLGIEVQKAELAVAEDKSRSKGLWGIVSKAAGKNPEIDPIERVWPDLTENDKRELISMAQMKARFNREHAPAKSSPTKSHTTGGKR